MELVFFKAGMPFRLLQFNYTRFPLNFHFFFVFWGDPRLPDVFGRQKNASTPESPE